MIRKDFLAKICNIAKGTGSPNKVIEAMKHIIKSTYSILHSLYCIDLLKKLDMENIGTESIERQCRKLCNEKSSNRKLVKIVMRSRIRNAYKDLRRNRYENNKIWREESKTLAHESILDEYMTIWSVEKEWIRSNLKTKRKKKIKWLMEKYKPNIVIPDHYKGYSIKDQDLGNEFERSYKRYGEVELTEIESEALKLHPKYTIFDKVDLTIFEAEVEKSLAKVRWERGDKSNGERNKTEKAEWYDIEGNTIDLRNMSSTDLPFNSRVFLPYALSENAEMELQMLKMKLRKIAEEYTESKKNSRERNITKQQEQGLKRLKERRNDKEIVIYQTDKTSRMAVDDTKNYITSMEKEHINKDPIITKKENRNIENILNAHALCWMRFLKAGEETGDVWRIKMSMKSHHNEPACLYSLRKDHKIEYDNNSEGPPTRPVCDATDGISKRFSYLISNLLQEVCYGPTVCNSTEEMLASINKLNDKGIGEDYVIGSADVKSLYPSLDIEHTVDIVCQEFIQKKIKIKGIDVEELGLYLVLNMDSNSLEQVGLSGVCPTRISHLGRKPEVTGCGVETSRKKRFEPWSKAIRLPTDREIEIMMREALRVALITILKNHTYQFNEKIRKQQEGGPIGLDLTGTVAKIYMKWWDRQLIGRLDDIDVQTNLYERYVDDINIVLKKVTPGARYVDGRLVITKESIDIDQGKKDDEITFEFIKTVGNSIHRSIQLEVDVPSNYEDGKLPILDLKVWIGQIENNVYKVIHEHYTKEIASKYVIDQKSAMSMQQKRPILTQMCLKVLLNNSEYLDEIKKKEKVEFFMRRMQASGYNNKIRYEVLKSAMNAYDKIKNNSLCPMFRGKEQNTPKKRSENKKKKRSWFRKGGYESVLFVQATPNSSLMKRIRNEIETST